MEIKNRNKEIRISVRKSIQEVRSHIQEVQHLSFWSSWKRKQSCGKENTKNTGKYSRLSELRTPLPPKYAAQWMKTIQAKAIHLRNFIPLSANLKVTIKLLSPSLGWRDYWNSDWSCDFNRCSQPNKNYKLLIVLKVTSHTLFHFLNCPRVYAVPISQTWDKQRH